MNSNPSPNQSGETEVHGHGLPCMGTHSWLLGPLIPSFFSGVGFQLLSGSRGGLPQAVLSSGTEWHSPVPVSTSGLLCVLPSLLGSTSSLGFRKLGVANVQSSFLRTSEFRVGFLASWEQCQLEAIDNQASLQVKRLSRVLSCLAFLFKLVIHLDMFMKHTIQILQIF